MFEIRDDPIIFLGMHRSGTTLLSKIFAELGVFLGHSLETHHESIFFRDANEWLLQISHGGWDSPANIQYLIEETVTRNLVELQLLKHVNSFSFLISYVGLRNILSFFTEPGIFWGWKDPRTTATWPIWKAIFPRAKFIFIYRNGIDVAYSLMTRESKRLGAINDRYFSLRCTKLDRAFELWEEYNQIFFNNTKKNPDIVELQLCYETLLNDPISEIERIISFIGLPRDGLKVAEVCQKIDHSRRFQFVNNPELLAFYHRTKNSSTMKKFGYDNLRGWAISETWP